MKVNYMEQIRKSKYREIMELISNIRNNQKLHFDTSNWVREVRWWVKKFEGIQFTWIGRKGNKVADRLAKQLVSKKKRLAKQLIPNKNSFYFHNYVPPRYYN